MQYPLAAAAAAARQPSCPRCNSTNTKFCYYNNYSLSQPRYFCKDCRRYWTKGMSLRNIPVGSGSRKNTNRSSSSSSPQSLSNPLKHPAPDPALPPGPLEPEPISALSPAAHMLEITGSSTAQLGNLNFLDGFDSGGSGSVSGLTDSHSGGTKNSTNPDAHPQHQP